MTYPNTFVYLDTMLAVERSVKRLSRVEQQQRTREALLDAAIELFVAKGIEPTSIEDVTAHAGFSRGAFYSNFDSKQELVIEAAKAFLEALHSAARPTDGSPDDPGAAYRERLERMRSVINDSASVFIAEFALYGIRHPEVREQFAALHQGQLAPAADFVATTLASIGIDPSERSDLTDLANIVQSLTFGLHLMGRLDTAVDAEALVASASKLLFAGMKPPRQPRKPR